MGQIVDTGGPFWNTGGPFGPAVNMLEEALISPVQLDSEFGSAQLGARFGSAQNGSHVWLASARG